MVAPVINMPSNKHSGVSGRDTQLFVQHSAESPLRGGYAQSLTNWARTPLDQGGPEASWPSFVDPIARVRMVAWPNSAWTQGLANQIGVGLECAGYARFSADEWLTPEGLKQLENLAHEWCHYLDLEAKAGNIIPLRWLSTVEVQKVMAGNRSIKGFCTHAQIDPGSRSDPGAGFPYARLMNRIKELRGEKVTPAAASKPVAAKDWFDMATEAQLRAIVRDEVKNNSVGYEGTGKQDLWSKINEIQAGVALLVKLVKAASPAAIAEKVWRRPIVSRNKGSEGKTYGADTYLSVNNANGHQNVRELSAVLSTLNTLANSDTTPAQEVVNQIKSQLSGLSFTLTSQDDAEATEAAKAAAVPAEEK